jgi:hypothetical protein
MRISSPVNLGRKKEFLFGDISSVLLIIFIIFGSIEYNRSSKLPVLTLNRTTTPILFFVSIPKVLP